MSEAAITCDQRIWSCPGLVDTSRVKETEGVYDAGITPAVSAGEPTSGAESEEALRLAGARCDLDRVAEVGVQIRQRVPPALMDG